MAPSIWQILIVIVLVMLLFGGRRIPQIMEDLAKGIQSFKKGMKDGDTPQVTKKDTAEEKKEP